MENGRSNKARWSAVVLTAAVAVGGVYALPSVFADGSPESQSEPNAAAGSQSSTNTGAIAPKADTSASASSVPAPVPVRVAAASTAGDAEVILPVVSVDPKKASAAASRSALIELEIMSLETVRHFPLDPSESHYTKLTEVRNRAVEVSSDPDAPADRVFATSRKLEEALDRYNDEAIKNANAVSKALAQAKTTTLNGRSESALDASGRLALLGIQEAQNRLAADSTQDGALSAYKQFLLRAAEANDIESFQPSDYSAALKQYDANIEARIESAGSYAKSADDLREAYDVSAEALEAAIDRSSGKNVLDAARAGVESTYAALTEGLTLAEDILKAEPLLDSPAGKEKGQYPSSAIGTLKRDIHKAERALETSKTAEPLTQARTELARAIVDFKAKRNA